MAVMDCGPDQALVALRNGQDVRMERAELLRHLRGRRLDPARLVIDPPECIVTMFTFDFLHQVPGVGRTRVREINRAAMNSDVNLAVDLGDLTPRRSQWLAQTLAVLPQARSQPRPTGHWPLVNRPQG